MSRTSFLAFFFPIVASVALAASWGDCGSAAARVQGASVGVAVPGRSARATVDVVLPRPVDAGSLRIEMDFLGIKVFTHVHDICETAVCPLAAGPVRLERVETIPVGIPKGAYTVRLAVTDGSDALLACASVGVDVELLEEDDVLVDEGIAAVNAMGMWHARRTPMFEGKKVRDVLPLLGARRAHAPNRASESVSPSVRALPTDFDGRKEWPNCIHAIRDQGDCGGCWAFGSTEALSDRFCIASKGKVNVVLSPEFLLSCDTNDYGCGGGYLSNAWAFLVGNGTVTDDCDPFSSFEGDVPACPATCKDGSPLKRYHVENGTVRNLQKVPDMQTDIMTNGPIEASFDVYQDFFWYESGVYAHNWGPLMGHHAIKVLGWGVEKNASYWLVANSWGKDFGMDGYFLIARGTDECKIEEDVWSGVPAL